ncbi:hypothetical protein ASG90_20395 [Nocardioides sp. Soil797]|nr:hypothetical protein ASG90_20395 [Nocardioides sp. Soil797]
MDASALKALAMDDEDVRALQEKQAGVIARRQVLALGGTDSDVARLVRRHALHRLLPGVYVEHNGPLSWEQQAWAAVLSCWPAVLAGSSALIAHGLKAPRFRSPARPSRRGVPSRVAWSNGGIPSRVSSSERGTFGEEFELAIDEQRSPGRTPGIRLRRLVDFEGQALMHLSPPRVRLEHAVLEVAARAPDEAGAVGVLSDAIQSRRTTPQRLLEALATMTRLRHRKFLSQLLTDVAEGAFSALEHRYLVRVERRHRLPSPRRQRREMSERGVVFRDADYDKFGVIVELDGRLGHEWSTDIWGDLDRDIDALIDQRVTIRARWRQVLDPCRLAASVARILWARGWNGLPRSCGGSCAVGVLLKSSGKGDIVDSQAESA